MACGLHPRYEHAALDERFADESGARLGHDEANESGRPLGAAQSSDREWSFGFDGRTTTLQQAGKRTRHPLQRDSTMIGYLVRRVLSAVPVMGAVALFVFLLLRLTPGDPAAVLAGENASP